MATSNEQSYTTMPEVHHGRRILRLPQANDNIRLSNLVSCCLWFTLRLLPCVLYELESCQVDAPTSGNTLRAILSLYILCPSYYPAFFNWFWRLSAYTANVRADYQCYSFYITLQGQGQILFKCARLWGDEKPIEGLPWYWKVPERSEVIQDGFWQ